MKPTESQQEHIDRIVAEPTKAVLMNLPTGSGKTVVGCFVAKELHSNIVLVVAPLNTQGGWKSHFERIQPGVPFRVIKSDNDNYESLRKHIPGIYFVTKDYFALSGTSLPIKKKKDGTFTKGRARKHTWNIKVDLMIFDESHQGNNRKTAVYKVLNKPKPAFKIASSATPAGNRFDRLWETTRWLWPDLIDRSKKRWSAQWCRFGYNAYNYSKKEIIGEKKPGAFIESLPCYITSDEVFKVPVHTIEVKTPMTPIQCEQYKAMKKDAIVWIEDNPLVADLPMVKKIRLRQIALGEVAFNENEEVDFAPDCKSSKISACNQIIARHPGEQIVFYTDSKRFAWVLANRIGARVWNGTITGPARDKLKAEFIAGSVRFIVAVIAAFGTGTDGVHLACNTEVWCNKGFNDVQNEQCEGRLNRRGQKKSHINRYVLVAPESGDTLDFKKLMENRTELRRSL